MNVNPAHALSSSNEYRAIYRKIEMIIYKSHSHKLLLLTIVCNRFVHQSFTLKINAVLIWLKTNHDTNSLQYYVPNSWYQWVDYKNSYIYEPRYKTP
jgi:hypothetical protein